MSHTPETSFTSAAVKAFKQNLERSNKFFAELTPARFETPVAAGKNRLIYLYGHLITVHDAMFPLLGIGELLHPELESAFLKSPDRATSQLPSADDLHRANTEVNEKLLAAFDAFTPEQWLERHTAVSPEDFAKEPHRNRYAILLSRTSHIAYHLGQAVLAPK